MFPGVALPMIPILAFVLSVAVSAPQAAQEPRSVTLSQVLAGEVFPLGMNPRDITPQYRAVAVTLKLPEGTPGGGATDAAIEASSARRALSAYYTRGEIALVDGVRHYVMYAFDPAEAFGPGGAHRLPAQLKLRLVHLDGVAALTPLGDGRELLKPLVEEGQRRREEALRRVRELGLAALRYSSDHEDELPYVQSTASAIAAFYPYVRLRDAPLSPTPGGRFLFNLNLAGVDLEDADPPKDTPLFYEELPDRTAPIAVVYADGNARTLTPEVFNTLRAGLQHRFPRRRNLQPLPPDHLLDTLPVSMGGRKGLPKPTPTKKPAPPVAKPAATKSTPPVNKPGTTGGKTGGGKTDGGGT